jgi:hypothetical protein
MSKIHLLARYEDQIPRGLLIRQNNVLRSGWWAVSEIVARQLIGGILFLHQSSSSRSWKGGAIVDVVASDHPDYPGRVGFLFVPHTQYDGVAWNWGQNARTPYSVMSIVV